MPTPQPPRHARRAPSGGSPLARLGEWVEGGIQDPHWLPRGILVAALAWLWARHIADPSFRGPFGGVNLVVHEAGHALFSWSGSTTLTVAGGTVLELAVPLMAGVLFARQRDPFAVTVAGFWLATALLDVAVYAGDARTRILPLVSVGEGPPLHDWGHLLGKAGILEHHRTVARLIRDAGVVIMTASLLAGGWITSRTRLKRAHGPPRHGG